MLSQVSNIASNQNQTKFETESQTAYNIRCRLIEKHECTFNLGHKVHFFSKLWKNNAEEQITVFFLDSLYCALQAPEKKVALRAYIQACEYSSEKKYRYLRYHWETAFNDAKRRVEGFLENSI